MPNKAKIHFYTNALAPYTIGLFNELQKALNNQTIVFFFDIAAEADRLWRIPYGKIQFNYHILSSSNFKIGSNTLYFPWRIISWCYRDRPKVIITSEFGLRTMLCVFMGKVIGAKVLVFSEDISIGRHRLSFARKIVRLVLARFVSGGIVVGSQSLRYLASLGVNKGNIVVVPYVADDLFAKKINLYDKKKLRKYLGIGKDVFVFLYVGQIIHRKGLDLLVKAICKAESLVPGKKILCLVVGGQISQSDPLKKSIDAHGKLFKIIGFQYPASLIKYYALADCFVLPTRYDTWGLVVNEAITCGLPVVVSKYAGSSDDLVKDGESGYVVDPWDIGYFANILARCVNNKKILKYFVQKSRGKLSGDSHALGAKKISALCHRVV
jgi:glycosyltransferase involved in cell wall biosynthesis